MTMYNISRIKPEDRPEAYKRWLDHLPKPGQLIRYKMEYNKEEGSDHPDDVFGHGIVVASGLMEHQQWTKTQFKSTDEEGEETTEEGLSPHMMVPSGLVQGYVVVWRSLHADPTKAVDNHEFVNSRRADDVFGGRWFVTALEDDIIAVMVATLEDGFVKAGKWSDYTQFNP